MMRSSIPALLLTAFAALVAVVLDVSEAIGADKPESATKAGIGRRWAVLIGVDQYLDPTMKPLRYCGTDVARLSEALIQSAGYESDSILRMTDDQPKAHLRPMGANIRRQIRDWLDLAGPNDVVLVYFSGHGFADASGQSYLVPSDFEPSKFSQTGYRTGDLRQSLQMCRAKQKMLVVDCCEAGGLRANDQKEPSSEEIANVFREAKGVVTFASCRRDESSIEWADKRQGLFTYFLVQGIAGAADFDRDRIINSDELYLFLSQKVPATAQREFNHRQTPVRMIGPEVEGVFAIGTVLRRQDRPQLQEHLPQEPADEALLRAPFDSETAARAQAAAAASLDQALIQVNSIGMKLILIPPGEFAMGSSESPEQIFATFPYAAERPEWVEGEQPVHRVRITRPFYMGQFEVTLGQFRRFVGETGYVAESIRDGKGGWGDTVIEKERLQQRPSFTWANWGVNQSESHPVVNVTWNDAEAFCAWLSRKEGEIYRLPTEAEWEYSCRSGTTTRFYFGDDPNLLAAYANIADATFKQRFPAWKNTLGFSDRYPLTAPVGRFIPNAFGLYDMHGNVLEWCNDLYAEDYYKFSLLEDPQGPLVGNQRVIRLSGWVGWPVQSRSADRGHDVPSGRNFFTGFRVAQDLK